MTDGLFVIPDKFRELLHRFDAAQPQCFDVPPYETDQKTRRPGKECIFNIAGRKE
jgi:hypothetical protein